MVNTYILVNPYIQGSFEKKVKAKNSIEAGKLIYNNLSEHFNNNIPKFLFTIQKGSSGKGKYYNFKVKENKKENEIDFSIEPFNIKNEKESLKNFEKKLNDFKDKNIEGQDGGAKKKAKKISKKPVKKASKGKKPIKRKPVGGKKVKKEKLESDDDDIFHDIDSDIDDDSPDIKTKKVQRYIPTSTFPIYNWWYDPYLYRLNSVYIPTFYSYVTPYIQIELLP